MGVEVRGLGYKGEVCAIVEGEFLWRRRFTTMVTDEGAGVGKGIFLMIEMLYFSCWVVGYGRSCVKGWIWRGQR